LIWFVDSARGWHGQYTRRCNGGRHVSPWPCSSSPLESSQTVSASFVTICYFHIALYTAPRSSVYSQLYSSIYIRRRCQHSCYIFLTVDAVGDWLFIYVDTVRRFVHACRCCLSFFPVNHSVDVRFRPFCARGVFASVCGFLHTISSRAVIIVKPIFQWRDRCSWEATVRVCGDQLLTFLELYSLHYRRYRMIKAKFHYTSWFRAGSEQASN